MTDAPQPAVLPEQWEMLRRCAASLARGEDEFQDLIVFGAVLLQDIAEGRKPFDESRETKLFSYIYTAMIHYGCRRAKRARRGPKVVPPPVDCGGEVPVAATIQAREMRESIMRGLGKALELVRPGERQVIVVFVRAAILWDVDFYVRHNLNTRIGAALGIPERRVCKVMAKVRSAMPEMNPKLGKRRRKGWHTAPRRRCGTCVGPRLARGADAHRVPYVCWGVPS